MAGKCELGFGARASEQEFNFRVSLAGVYGDDGSAHLAPAIAADPDVNPAPIAASGGREVSVIEGIDAVWIAWVTAPARTVDDDGRCRDEDVRLLPEFCSI